MQFLSLEDLEFDEATITNPEIELLGGSVFQKMHWKRKQDDGVIDRMNLDSPIQQIQGNSVPPPSLLGQCYYEP